MQSDRIERVKFIVSAALARPVHEREAYLNAVCGHDASLRGEVDYYLNNSEKTEQFIYRGGEAARVTNDFSDARRPRRFPAACRPIRASERSLANT